MEVTSFTGILFFQDLSLVHSINIHFQPKGISFDWTECTTLQIRNENSLVYFFCIISNKIRLRKIWYSDVNNKHEA